MKNLSVIFVFLLFSESFNLLHWLQNHLLACPFKQTLGIDCPGCGFQRSILALLQGNFFASFKYYPATVPILFLITFLGLHLKLEFKNGAFVLKLFYLVVTFIIIFNYVYKIISHQLI